MESEGTCCCETPTASMRRCAVCDREYDAAYDRCPACARRRRTILTLVLSLVAAIVVACALLPFLIGVSVPWLASEGVGVNGWELRVPRGWESTVSGSDAEGNVWFALASGSADATITGDLALRPSDEATFRRLAKGDASVLLSKRSDSLGPYQGISGRSQGGRVYVFVGDDGQRAVTVVCRSSTAIGWNRLRRLRRSVAGLTHPD